MANRKKLLTSAVALGTAGALALGGTFAWQSINQTAINEASDIVNPGGRLHDDFDGANKDVYVENFAEEDIFARLRLEEYMEVVMNYGDAELETTEILLGSKEKPEGSEEYEYTYARFDFAGRVKEDGTVTAGNVTLEAEEGETRSWWTWTTGREDSEEVYFMPTFDKNKDSLAADRNGLYAAGKGQISVQDEDQYTDYHVYADGEEKTANEIYDGDEDLLDELTDTDRKALIESGDGFATAKETYKNDIVLVENETHTAKAVGTSKGLISMDEWMELYEGLDDTTTDEARETLGGYWVYDTDGWVYWSSPIGKGETTGRLLDSVKMTGVIDDTWYYAINVVGQFATANDLGQPGVDDGEGNITGGTGFYADGETVSEDAKTFLDTITAGAETTGGDEGEDPWAPGALLFRLTQRDAEDAYSYYDVSDTSGFLYDLPIDQANVFDVTVGSGVTLSVSFENRVPGTAYEDNVLTLAPGDVSVITVTATYDETDYTFKIIPVYSDIIITKGDAAEMKYYRIPNGAYKLSAVNFDGDVTYTVSEEAMRSGITEIDGAKHLTMGGYESAASYTVTATDGSGNSGTVTIFPQDTHPFDGAVFWLYQDYGSYGLHGIGQLIDGETSYWSASTKYVVSVDLPVRPAANFTWTLTDAEGGAVSSDKIKFAVTGNALTFECGADLTAADTFTLKGVSDAALPTGDSGETGTEYVFYLNFGEKSEGGEEGEEDELVRYLTLYESEADAEYVRMSPAHTLTLDAGTDLLTIQVDVISWSEDDEKISTPLTKDTDYTYDADTQTLQFMDTETVTAAITGAQEIKVSSGGYFGYVNLVSREAYAVDQVELAWTSDEDATGSFTIDDNDLTYTVGAGDKETVTLTPTATLYDADNNEIETAHTIYFHWGTYSSDIYGVYDDCYVTKTDEYNEDNTAGNPEVLYIAKTDDTKIQIHTAKVTEAMEIPFEVDIKINGQYVGDTIYGTLSIQPNA